MIGAASRAAMRIAVTGIGAVTPFGEGVDSLWKGLVSGASQIRAIERFDTSKLRSHLGALVGPHDPRRVIPPSSLRRLDANSRFSILAAAEALGRSRRQIYNYDTAKEEVPQVVSLAMFALDVLRLLQEHPELIKFADGTDVPDTEVLHNPKVDANYSAASKARLAELKKRLAKVVADEKAAAEEPS